MALQGIRPDKFTDRNSFWRLQIGAALASIGTVGFLRL
jgi:hypothetical protein